MTRIGEGIRVDGTRGQLQEARLEKALFIRISNNDRRSLVYDLFTAHMWNEVVTRLLKVHPNPSSDVDGLSSEINECSKLVYGLERRILQHLYPNLVGGNAFVKFHNGFDSLWKCLTSQVIKYNNDGKPAQFHNPSQVCYHSLDEYLQEASSLGDYNNIDMGKLYAERKDAYVKLLISTVINGGGAFLTIPRDIEFAKKALGDKKVIHIWSAVNCLRGYSSTIFNGLGYSLKKVTSEAFTDDMSRYKLPPSFFVGGGGRKIHSRFLNRCIFS